MTNTWNSILKRNKTNSQHTCTNLCDLLSVCVHQFVHHHKPMSHKRNLYNHVTPMLPGWYYLPNHSTKSTTTWCGCFLMYCCNVSVQLNPWVKTFTTIITITRISCSPFTIKGKLFIHTIVNHFTQNIWNLKFLWTPGQGNHPVCWLWRVSMNNLLNNNTIRY